MSQTTFTGEIIETIAPWSKMKPKERIIYNYLRTCGRGKTEKQIQTELAYTDVGTFGNKLREMRACGWVRSWKPSKGQDQLWYAVEAIR